MQALYIVMIILLFATGAYGSALSARRKKVQKPDKELKKHGQKIK